MKMEAAWSSEMLVSYCIITQYYNPEYHNLQYTLFYIFNTEPYVSSVCTSLYNVHSLPGGDAHASP